MAQSQSLYLGIADTVTVAVAECHQMVNGEVTVSQSLQSSKVKITGSLGIPMAGLGLGQGLVWLLVKQEST